LSKKSERTFLTSCQQNRKIKNSILRFWPLRRVIEREREP